MKKLLYVSLVAASLTGVSFAAGETAPVAPAATPAPVVAVAAPAADAATTGYLASFKNSVCGATSKTVEAVKAHPALSAAIIASVGLVIWNTFAEKDEEATLEDLTSTTDKKGVRVWLKKNWTTIATIAAAIAAGAAIDYAIANRKPAAPKVEAPKTDVKATDVKPAADKVEATPAPVAATATPVVVATEAAPAAPTATPVVA